jgi:hypothetical protein
MVPFILSKVLLLIFFDDDDDDADVMAEAALLVVTLFFPPFFLPPISLYNDIEMREGKWKFSRSSKEFFLFVLLGSKTINLLPRGGH